MATQTQERKLKMHSNLLYLTIQRQAGTIGKAVMEGVMNLVDAKATMGAITLTREKLIIEDDGQGFRSMKEIDEWFEHFGQPHDASEDKTYGEFRMGRGQIFVFGENVWRSGEFQMTLDFKHRGITYDLTTGLKPHKGCRIEVKLYKMLSQGELRNVITEIEKLCKYVPVPVTLNGSVVTIDPATEKWDHIIDEAYVRLKKTGDLHVYHLGAFVKTYSSYDFGMGGVIVGKERFLLNMARNDILVSECKVWRKVRKFFEDKADAVTRSSSSLNDNQRQRMASRFMDDDLDEEDARDMRLFTAVTNRHFNARQLVSKIRQYNSRYTSAPKGSRMGVQLMKDQRAFVFADETLERFGVRSARELVTAIRNRVQSVDYHADDWTYVPFDKMTEGVDGEHIQLVAEDLTPTEQIWQMALHKATDTMHWRLRERGVVETGSHVRNAIIGTSETAQSWTDGSTYIAISREWLEVNELDFKGILAACELLLHSYCHSMSDMDHHDHTLEFYETFHDNLRVMREAASEMWTALPAIFENQGRRMNQKLLKDRDKAHQLSDNKDTLKDAITGREKFNKDKAA